MNEKTKKAKIVAALRLLHRQWHPKKEARKRDTVKVQVGTFKNGKPKYLNKCKCAECGTLIPPKETNMDHLDPVVSVEDGFQDWNTFIDRMFVSSDEYQTLCKPCHKVKSKIENALRRKNAKSKV